MQLPKRKPGKYTHIPFDPVMTGHKYAQLQDDLAGLKKKQPHAAAEVARLAELGDFSENVEYQQAKGRLRGILNAITRIEFQLNQAEVIEPGSSQEVAVGSTVTVEAQGEQKTYTILGSSEADPAQGIISYTSPLGSALLGASTGDVVELRTKKTTRSMRIVSIS